MLTSRALFKEDERAEELLAALDSKSLVACYWVLTDPLDLD